MLSEVARQFIREHLQEDPGKLLLAAHRYPGLPMREIAVQLTALGKVRAKIPSWYDPELEFPPVLSIEQSSSEAAARFKTSLFEGRRMADLTGGLGIDAFFWSRRFDSATYVDANADLVALARHNFAVKGVRNVEFVASTAEDFLRASDSPDFDLLYLDPARRDTAGQKVFRLEDCRPNVLTLRDQLLARAPRVLIKLAPMLDLKQAARQLGAVSHIWVVSVDGEVKETLFLLQKDAPDMDDIPVEAVCLNAGGERVGGLSFTWNEERMGGAEYGVRSTEYGVRSGEYGVRSTEYGVRSTEFGVRNAEYGVRSTEYGVRNGDVYLYEPDAAVLKAGAFRVFAARFGLRKLHPNTHLYTSDTLVADIPGRVFRIEACVKYDRKAVGVVVPEGRANVSVRNFPDKPEAVRRKLGLLDGGDRYVFVATEGAGRVVALVCRVPPNSGSAE